MSIGRTCPSELREWRDAHTGKRIRLFTNGTGHSYPLYYFTPSITIDGRYMVIHRHMDGVLNLWRLDLADGSMVQLTDGQTLDASWHIWCEPGVRGVYDHLSALNRSSREVWYFDGTGLFATQLETLHNRQVWDLGDRVCISQNDFSPDGNIFIFVHADRRMYQEAVTRQHWEDHQAWRNTIPIVIGAIDIPTGQYRVVAELDYHVHHVIFLDQESVIVNHLRDGMGMWRLGLDGRDYGPLRPLDAHGSPCHQAVTANGIWYETINWNASPRTWLGRYDLATNTWREFPIPLDGYIHVGHDPAGLDAFFEIDGLQHELVRVREPFDDAHRRFETLCVFAPYPPHTGGQRYHAHPFLDPTRQWIFHTRVMDGISQVAAIEWE